MKCQTHNVDMVDWECCEILVRGFLANVVVAAMLVVKKICPHPNCSECGFVERRWGTNCHFDLVLSGMKDWPSGKGYEIRSTWRCNADRR